MPQALMEGLSVAIGRRRFLKKLAAAAAGSVATMVMMSSPARAVIVGCCNLCFSPTSCSCAGGCQWCWSCCDSSTNTTYSCCERYRAENGAPCDGSCTLVACSCYSTTPGC